MSGKTEVPEEAVEAAVKAWDHHWGDRYGDEALEEMGEEVRVALEAAAPFIAAKALEEAAEKFGVRSQTLFRTMQNMAESGDYVTDEITRYGAYSAEANSTTVYLRARAAAVRGEG